MLWIFKEVIYENWFVGIFFMESKKNVKLFIECSLLSSMNIQSICTRILFRKGLL